MFVPISAIRPVLSHGGHNNDDPGKQFDVEGVFCKALHHSGKLMCVRPRKELKEERGDFSDRNADRVVIEFDSLQVGILYILNLNMLLIKVISHAIKRGGLHPNMS